MAIEVVMPKLGLTMTEGILVQWLINDGEQVQKDQPLFEIETDKATTEAEAPVGGILRIVTPAGTTVPVNGLVAYLLAEGEAMPASSALSALHPSEIVAETQSVSLPAATAESEPSSPQRPPVSPAARKKARELGIDIDNVPARGDGSAINVADVVAFAEAQQQTKVEPKFSFSAGIRITAIARRMAEEAGIDPAQIPASGGVIGKEDVERAIAAREQAAPSPRTEPDRIPIRGIRQKIAERMLASATQTASVTLMTEADATGLVRLRADLNARHEAALGFRLSYNVILISIAARALQEFRYMNARQEGEFIVLVPEVNIGLAVDTERGLIVPVIHNADQKAIVQIARELNEKAQKALDGTILPDDLTGGTFTITNLGAFGIDAFTPIINPPELAVLGVGRIQRKPAEFENRIELRDRVALSLTFDHRLVDGAPAARFLQHVTELIENPYRGLAVDQM